MPFLDKLEARFGRFAIPGLVQFIAGLQLLTFVIFAMLQPEGKAAYLDFLTLDGTRVLHGQVWRLFTYIFIPGSSSLLVILIKTMFLMWLGRGLEAAWGPFRLTLYFVGGMLAIALGSLIFGYSATGLYLFWNLLLAFAVIYPNEEIMLYFLIPLKVKWLAWLSVALATLSVMRSPSDFWPTLFSALNFLITFGPAFIKERQHLAKVGQRRAAFESGSNSGAAFFHQCTVCQKTEVDDPKLDFRVNAEGDEICDDCRAKASISG